MKELNKMWRGENRPAKILSFPQDDYKKVKRPGTKIEGSEKEPPKILGDLAIRCDKSSISDRLLVHGVLHLMGYTHDTEKNYDKMRKKEKEIIEQLKRMD